MKPSITSETKYWPFIILATCIAALVFVAPFVGIITVAALMAFLFYPLYKKLTKKIRSTSFAAAITLLLSLIFIATPIAIILFITVVQLISFVGMVTTQYANVSVGTLPDSIKIGIQAVNGALQPVVGQASLITGQGIVSFLQTTLPTILRGIVSIVVNIAGGIPLATIMAIMYIILFCEFLIYGKKLVALLTRISPFETDVTKIYFDRIGTMAKAMVKGQFLISVIISALSAFLLVFLGMGQYFFLLFVLFTLLNLIPLGCGILMFPIAIIAILSGNVVPGILVLIGYILVSNLDSVIRPKIIPKSVTLSAGLTTIAAFGGLYYYGLLGVVYGPIVMIVLVTTITMYANYRDKNTVTDTL